ncbi:hypothetical protein LRP67_10585 [Nocardioides sp. cx-169]|uniref:hypothetical protein n=1 Tax=Nocardioides sp. cx-169 TaxID=2899080 RepID=UPI001E2B2B23|nr:hypothetical protein [Nocardioides sp. cx-169]MCD4534530.1 hypothetical protein [Nocardioides sp. cx-169]
MSGNVAVVTVAAGDHPGLELHHKALSICRRPPDQHVVVAVDAHDLISWQPPRGVASRVVPLSPAPEGVPYAAAMNAGGGVALAAGADVLVFLDLACVPGEEMVAAYERAACQDPAHLWTGPASRLGPPPDAGYDLCRLDDHVEGAGEGAGEGDRRLWPRLSLALHRKAWAHLHGFDENLIGHSPVPDLLHRAATADLYLREAPEARGYLLPT